MRTLALITFLLSIFQISFSQVSDKDYKIYSVKAQKEITIEDIANDMDKFNVLFYGEEHNDSVTHYLEKTIFESLYKKYNSKITLSMEMFDRDVQHIMNEYLTSDIREKSFKTDAHVWHNYRDYRPMVEFSKTNKLDVICANAARRYSNLVGRKGQKALMDLPKTSKNSFAPLPFDTASGKYYEKLMDLSGHSTSASKDTIKKVTPPAMSMGNFSLILAQSLWDATMAYSVFEYLKTHPLQKVFHVNGRFHSDEGFAVVTQLKKYNPKLKVLIISAFSDDSFPNVDWKKHTHLGDYIIVTNPNVPKTYKD